MLFVYDGLRSQDHIQIGRGVLFLFYVQLLGCLAIPIEYGRKAKQVSRPFCFYVCLSVGACGRGKIFLCYVLELFITKIKFREK